jgi:hypothetical protein
MRLLNNLVGQTFGKWMVLSFSKEESSFFYWKCRCSCGIEKDVLENNLISGKSKSCGHFQDMAGCRFGRLVVLSYDHSSKGGHTFWKCQCDCGAIKVIDRSELINKTTISCGCYRIENSSKIATQTYFLYKNQFKHKWYFYGENNDIIRCSSSYEVFFWNYFYHIKNTDIVYEPKTFLISDNRRYTPDFFFPSENLWIELKGSFEMFMKKNKQDNKILEFSETNKISIYSWNEIFSKCSLPFKSYGAYKKRAEKKNISIEEYLAKMFYLSEESLWLQV